MTSKRKAAAAASAAAAGDNGAQLSKRRKVEASSEETSETTTATGLRFLEEIKAARDKRGHPIATHFLELPDKKKIPQYYQEIGLPMSLDIIEGKLKGGEYPTMTIVESDLRRMVGNAKTFNVKSSEIFSDAEKMRKAIVSFMMPNNPAYKSKDYVPAPTPVPENWQDRLEPLEEPPEANAEGEMDQEGTAQKAPPAPEPIEKPKPSLKINGPSPVNASNSRRATSTPGVQDAEGAGESFDGDTFQQAQEKIITEMINLKNDDDLLISTAFINLPSRELKDYYRLIKHPVCLKSVQKAVKGVKGREKPTGQTLFRSWQTFEQENSYIWNNAREYNEDESEISELAGMLESYFTRRLAEARRAVQEPPQPKVKLRMPARSPDPPKITLRFGGQKQQGSGGVSVDSEALKRQQDLVNAGANGRGSFTGPAAPMPQRASQEKRSGSTEHTAMNGVKKEVPMSQSPSLGALRLNGDNTRPIEAGPSPGIGVTGIPGMPPPSAFTPLPHYSSGSPHPRTLGVNGDVSSHHPPSNTFDARFRKPGKGASDALISNLSVSTHPGLKLDRHFYLDIPPSSTTTQHSVTVSLPSTHYFLRICPNLAQHLNSRPSKVFVTANMQRLIPIPQKPEETDSRKPLYETRILPGVNRIEIEIVAGVTRGAPRVGPGPDLEMEKITVFANLSKP